MSYTLYNIINCPLTSVTTCVYMKLGNHCGKVVSIVDCDCVVREFKLQSHSDDHFWTNTLEKGMKLLISPAMD